MKKKIFFYIFIIILVVFLIGPKTVQAGIEHNVWGWAWSENLGWISFNSKNCDCDYTGTDCDSVTDGLTDNTGTPAQGNYDNCPVGEPIQNYGVNINPITGDFSGYAWSDMIGWIRFDPLGPYPESPNFSVRVAFSPPEADIGMVEGWARACFVFKDSVARYGVDCQCGEACQDLKPDSELGGWDGWMKTGLGGATYQVGLDRSVTPNELFDFAWGNEYLYTIGGEEPIEFNVGWIGWISFNCRNGGYNEGTEERYDVCGTSDYKVYTDLGAGGNAPYAENLEIEGGEPVYCGIGPGKGYVSLAWTYQDNEGDNQYMYQLQIDDDSGFGSPQVDCSACQIVVPGDTGTSGSIVLIGDPTTNCVTGDYNIKFRTTYYWRVRVMAEQGSGDCSSCVTGCSDSDWNSCPADCISDWVEYNDSLDPDGDGDPQTFTTINKAYPYPDFSFVPLNPKVGKPVTFIDNSRCYDSSDNEFFCKIDNTGNMHYNWNYDDGFEKDYWTTDSPGPPGPDSVLHIYEEEGDYNVRLKVSDACPEAGGTPCPERECEKTLPLSARLPIPGWKETFPF